MIEPAVEPEHGLPERLEKFREDHPVLKATCTGFEWEYLVGGSGPGTLILFPGGGGSAEDMFEIMTALEDEYQVIAIGCPDDLNHVPDLIQAVAQIMDHHSVTQACLVGHSLGGMFAECFMLRYPERASGMILANMAHYGTFREVIIRGALAIAPFLPRDWINRQVLIAFQRLLAGSPNADFWAPFFAAEFDRLDRKALENRIACMLGAIGSYPAKRLDLDGWKRAVLILESDNETGFTIEERAALRQLYPQAIVHQFEGAGHMSLYTQPEEFTAVIRSFLSQY